MKKGIAMASMLQSGNILNLTNRLEPARAEFSEKQAKQGKLQISLMRDLQTSLEIEAILHIFLNGLRKALPVDGIGYQHQETALDYKTAIQGKHKVSYNLDSDQGDLGTILFTRHRPFQEDELATIENLMSCLLYPLRNSLKYHQAITAANTEPLTKCGNRQAMDSALHREIDLARRDQTPLSIILFDFDHFKQINDEYGHQGGDQVLRLTCDRIRSSMRKTDLIFRYGGEEFMILLHKTDLEGATNIAEKIRQEIEKTATTFKDKSIPATISAGVAELKGIEGISSIIERADKALYRSKNLGRNQVNAGE